ncbi:MAG TPA: serine hydrolase domain-containing protein [Parvularculaceae bacterium]|nr:serine hydrolase domain-containing protein [Parvularculaceae bacterium]
MNKLGEGFLRAALCATVLAVMAAFSAASAQGDVGAPLAGIESYLDGIAAAQMGDDYPPGMTVAVATPEGAFVKSYGVADFDTGEPATPDTLFRIASVSKTFIWVSVMMLYDEGKIDLDADVNTYLKNIRIPEAFGAPVTMNDLMAHRAGFEDTLGDFFESRSGRTYEESMIRHMPKRVAPPGLRSSYSNWGSDLAAQIVADLSGVPYDEFVRTRILTPLGMDSTTMHDPASIAGKPLNDPALDARMAKPHKLEGGAPKVLAQDAIEPTYAAGAFAMSARDMAKWMQMFLRGGAYGDRGARLLSPQAFAIMRTRAFPDRPNAPDFAHGFMETEMAGYTTFGHGGTLTGFIADMTIVPSLHTGVFVVVNGAEGTRVSDAVSLAVVEKIAGADPYSQGEPEQADAALIAAAQDAAGTYLGDRRLFSKFEKIASLGGEMTIVAHDDGSLTASTEGSVKRYFPIAPDTWTDRARDRLHAYRGKDGKVIRISARMGTNTFERIGFFQSSGVLFTGLCAAAFFSLTAFLGAWRRQGRRIRETGAGLALSIGQIAVALSWFAFLGIFVWALMVLSGASLTDLVEIGWPPSALVAAQVAAYAAAAAALANAAASVPVWTASGWSVWRKAHHALFAAAGLFAVYGLWEWRIILAPMTTT